MNKILHTKKPLLWSAAFFMIALIAGCGGGSSAVTPDTTAPTVPTVAPRNLSIDAAINTNVTAIFSEAMNSSTINDTTFTLKLGGVTPVLGVVTYAGKTATFNPNADLTGGSSYTATLSIGVKDLAGNALAADKTWTFTPVNLINSGPEPVDLGTAGDFVILSKSGISATVGTVVTGDLGVSPIAATAITGFGLVLDGTGTFSTSTPALATVTGRIYAADYSPPTPANLTTAIIDLESAYTDAAGRTLPAPVVNTGAGLLGGLNLVPGLYTFTNNVLISTPLTLTGNASDVWIFQIPGTLTLSSGQSVILNGASPKNVFWQVAGATSIETTAIMRGVILGATSIALQTGGKISGRMLSKTAVTLDASEVTAQVIP